MCWVCEHPESTRQERLEYLRGVLHQHSRVVIGVHEERYRPPYSYTLGLTDRELPELVITGLPHKRAADELTRAAWELLGGGTLAPGKQIRTVDGLLAEVVKVAEPGAHLDVAADLYGQQLAALQLVYTDRRGHWPWDRRSRAGRGGQPVLGARAKQAA
ncbi:MAG: DUF4262 domain-containing protein [Streptosporangiaceae bacterium]